MAYSLEFDAGRVLSYLHNHSALSREDRGKVFTALNDLRDNGDTYRANPERRLDQGSPFFWYDLILRCSDGRLRRFWFVANDAAAAYGVLRVEYIDEGGPGPSG